MEKSMNILTNIVARILFVLPMAMFGLGHFANADSMANMMLPGIPGNTILVYLTGLALIAITVSILIKKKASLATLLLGIMLVLFALIIHLPGMSNPDEMMAMSSTSNFFKDLGLAGAAFFMSGVFRKQEAE